MHSRALQCNGCAFSRPSQQWQQASGTPPGLGLQIFHGPLHGVDILTRLTYLRQGPNTEQRLTGAPLFQANGEAVPEGGFSRCWRAQKQNHRGGEGHGGSGTKKRSEKRLGYVFSNHKGAQKISSHMLEEKPLAKTHVAFSARKIKLHCFPFGVANYFKATGGGF